MQNNNNKPLLVSEKEEIFFKDYHDMELLFEKLKFLNYYSEYIVPLKTKPFHHYYFMVNSNSGEHFYFFCTLATWLIKKCGISFEESSDFEDPNVTISRILNVVRDWGIPIEFPPNKLKTGTGCHVIFILNTLCNEALKTNKIEINRPEISKNEEDTCENETDENAKSIDYNKKEIILDITEEDIILTSHYNSQDYSEDEKSEDYEMFKDDKNESLINQKTMKDDENRQKELERVMPLLHVVTKYPNYDWRSRLCLMHENYNEIKQTVTSAKLQLSKIQKRVQQNLNKIKNREKYLNKEFEPTIKEFNLQLNQLSKIKEDYSVYGKRVNEKMRTLAHLNDTLKIYKEKAENRGNFVTDGTPLINIKREILKIKSEIISMNVKIGVGQCLFFYAKINEKRRLENSEYVNSLM